MDKIKKNFNTWNSTSDTETLINYFQLMGINKTLEDVQGMFAFAIYDKLKEILYLARDPAGEKHLYYYKDSEKLVISSVPGFIKEYCNLNKISKEIIFDYLSRRHLITSHKLCIDGIKQLKSGHKIEFDLKDIFKTS